MWKKQCTVIQALLVSFLTIKTLKQYHKCHQVHLCSVVIWQFIKTIALKLIFGISFVKKSWNQNNCRFSPKYYTTCLWFWCETVVVIIMLNNADINRQVQSLDCGLINHFFHIQFTQINYITNSKKCWQQFFITIRTQL